MLFRSLGQRGLIFRLAMEDRSTIYYKMAKETYSDSTQSGAERSSETPEAPRTTTNRTSLSKPTPNSRQKTPAAVEINPY